MATKTITNKKAPTVEQVYTMLKNNHLSGEVYNHDCSENIIAVHIEWGDWKHSHARLKWLMNELFPCETYKNEVTEEDGSDCYSAIHYFYY